MRLNFLTNMLIIGHLHSFFFLENSPLTFLPRISVICFLILIWTCSFFTNYMNPLL